MHGQPLGGLSGRIRTSENDLQSLRQMGQARDPGGDILGIAGTAGTAGA